MTADMHYVTVKAAIWKDGKILVQKEIEDENGKHVLNLPGGRIDAGENIYNGLKREVMEEIGVEVKVLDERPVSVWSDFWNHSDKSDPVVGVLFECELLSEDFKLNHDIEHDEDIMDIMYMTPQEIEESDLHLLHHFYMKDYFNQKISL